MAQAGESCELIHASTIVSTRDQQQRDHGAGARVAPRQQRHDAAAGREEHGHLGDLAQEPCGHRDERPERWACSTTAPPCGRPGRACSVSTARRAGSRRRRRAARCRAAAGARRRARATAGRARRRRSRRRRRAPSCACRASPRTRPRTRSPAPSGRRRESVVNACSQQVVLTIPSSATSVYMRPSCAYWVRNGLTAASSAAIHAVRRPNSVHPAQNATGTQSSGEQHRQAVHALLRVPREREPEVQQHVVQRRRAVLAQHVRDVAERPVGDPDRQPLVDPEARAELARAQQDGDGEQHADPQRHGDPRAADRPCPQLPRRTGGVGGHGHQSRARGSAVCAGPRDGIFSGLNAARCCQRRSGGYICDRSNDGSSG